MVHAGVVTPRRLPCLFDLSPSSPPHFDDEETVFSLISFFAYPSICQPPLSANQLFFGDLRLLLLHGKEDYFFCPHEAT